MSTKVSLSKGQRVKVTVSPVSKLTAKGAQYEVVSGDCTLEDDKEDETAKYIVAGESVGESIIKVSGKIHTPKEPGGGEEGEGAETEEGGEEVSAAARKERERKPRPTPYEEGEGEEEEEEPETAEELICVEVTDPNSGSLGVNVGTPEDVEDEEEEEGGEGTESGAGGETPKKRRKKKDRGRKKPKK